MFSISFNFKIKIKTRIDFLVSILFEIYLLSTFRQYLDHLQSLVVYRIKCKDCGDFYVGKTSRCIYRRVIEHQKGTGVGEYKSSLFKHAKNTGHSIDYKNVEIIDGASIDHKLLLKEILQINKLKPQLIVQKSLLC